MTHQKSTTVLDESISPREPHPLPYAEYPKAADVGRHGLQPLPESLPLVDFARASPTAATGTPRWTRRTLPRSRCCGRPG